MRASDTSDPCPVAMRGIVPSFNTPFTADDRIDERGVRRLVDTTVRAGCVGMLILAVAGEHASLVTPEKERFARVAVEHTAGRIPVIMSVTAATPDVSIELAHIARDSGAHGICCQVPHGLSDAALDDAIARIADAGPSLFMLQDLDWGGGGLPLATIVRLFERLPQFQCLKVEVVPAGPKYTAVLAATGGRLHVSGGWAVSQMPEALARGVHAFMGTALDNVYVRIYGLHRAGQADAARALFERLLPVFAFTQAHINVSIRFLKALRLRQGLFATANCRPPVPELDAFQQREAEALLARAQALDEEAARANQEGR